MNRRSLVIGLLLVALALPLSASQFVELPFDQIATESKFIVRGTIEKTWSAWDDSHEVIYTYAQLRVSRYFGETTGPDMLVVREVGGTVDGYTQEAIGFPAVRGGEEVVLMLTPWDDSADLRIHAFNQGKFLVRTRGGRAVLVPDSVRQGDARLENRDARGFLAGTDAIDHDVPALGLDEFETMVEDARAGRLGRTAILERQ